MTIRMMLPVVCAVAAAVVASASAQSGATAHPVMSFQAGGTQPLTLVPVAGTWSAEYEDSQPVQQVLTIDGAAASKAPDAEAAAGLFGPDAPGFVKALAAPGAFPMAIARDVKDFRGGRLQVQFKIIAGATDQTAGILFNLKADGSYTYARYNTKDGNVAVWKFENGARTVLKHGELHEQLAKNEWHSLDVTITGPAVAATVNGRLSVRHSLDGPIAGRVGVWTKADSVTAFRRFTSTHAGHAHRQP